MYQITKDKLPPESLTVLGGIRDKIDLLAFGEVQSLHYFAYHFTSGGSSLLTVRRTSDEYSVLTEGVFNNRNNRFVGNAATSLAFLEDFNVTEAGLIIDGSVKQRENEFLATSPERFFSFATMVAVQLEDVFPPTEPIL